MLQDFFLIEFVKDEANSAEQKTFAETQHKNRKTKSLQEKIWIAFKFRKYELETEEKFSKRPKFRKHDRKGQLSNAKNTLERKFPLRQIINYSHSINFSYGLSYDIKQNTEGTKRN